MDTQSMPGVLCCDDRSSLGHMNSVFRAIDLTCLLHSPIVSGFLMTFVSPLSAITLLAIWSTLAWAPELALLRWACRTSVYLR